MGMRAAIVWTLYGIGHAIYVVFDQWLPCGMIWPTYWIYSRCMRASAAVQGDGAGPWLPIKENG